MDFFFLEAHALIRNPPAHAGNTNGVHCRSKIHWDHPRLRGEYNEVVITFQKTSRSPPLARGIQALTVPCNRRFGITPACAGNT